MQLHPRDIIDRIASLDEATVAEPTVEPTEAPPTERPTERPTRRPSRSPWTMPPDMEPGQEPRPKAEDESSEIENWLEATEQPIRDWDWDGNELRLALDDGTTEVYSRGQLEEIGVFGGQMAFAESEDGPEEDLSADPDQGPGSGLYDFEGPDAETVQSAIDAEQPGSPEADGTLDMILGRTPTPAEPAAGGEGTIEVIQIDGSQAGEIMGAVSDLVKAIIGSVGDAPEGGDESEDKKGDKKEKDSKEDKDKSKKEKKSKDKKEDKDEDKSDDKKDDEKDDE